MWAVLRELRLSTRGPCSLQSLLSDHRRQLLVLQRAKGQKARTRYIPVFINTPTLLVIFLQHESPRLSVKSEINPGGFAGLSSSGAQAECQCGEGLKVRTWAVHAPTVRPQTHITELQQMKHAWMTEAAGIKSWRGAVRMSIWRF